MGEGASSCPKPVPCRWLFTRGSTSTSPHDSRPHPPEGIQGPEPVCGDRIPACASVAPPASELVCAGGCGVWSRSPARGPSKAKRGIFTQGSTLIFLFIFSSVSLLRFLDHFFTPRTELSPSFWHLPFVFPPLGFSGWFVSQEEGEARAASLPSPAAGEGGGFVYIFWVSFLPRKARQHLFISLFPPHLLPGPCFDRKDLIFASIQHCFPWYLLDSFPIK